MSRHTKKSRIALVAERKKKRGEMDVEPELNPRHLVRRGGDGPIRNRIHLPHGFYGFLTEADGPPRGPWYAIFECTDSVWMNITLWGLQHDMRKRVLGVLAGRTFADAWENCAIAHRVILRHAHAAYLQALHSEFLAPPLMRYEIELDASELANRFQLAPLEPGRWYGLDLIESDTRPELRTGIYRTFDPDTLELGKEESYLLTGISRLRRLPERPDEFLFERFESEALIEAFHSRFREEALPVDDGLDDEEL